MLDGNWDRELLLSFNAFVGNNRLHYLWGFTSNALLRGFPIFFSLVSLWFSGDCQKRRSRMLIGFFAVCLATLISVWLQSHLAVHTRPILDPELHLKLVYPEFTLHWDRTGSFPSDTGTLFFALATIVLLENRLVGSICFLWVAALVAVPRVVFGWHYPSDIIGSLVLGPGLVLILNRIGYLRMVADRALVLFASRMYLVHALLFIFLADAANLFESLQQAGKGLLHLM